MNRVSVKNQGKLGKDHATLVPLDRANGRIGQVRSGATISKWTALLQTCAAGMISIAVVARGLQTGGISPRTVGISAETGKLL